LRKGEGLLVGGFKEGRSFFLKKERERRDLVVERGEFL